MNMDNVIQPIYLVSAILFILSLMWMNHPSTARRGVFSGVIAMLAAIGGTLLLPEITSYTWIIIAVLAGSAVGVPLAMVPPLFSALGINTVPVYILVMVSVALLHLLALNLLYPKIVGSRVHLNPLVVTFSLMLWGFLWDAPGLLLAIPLTAGLKAVCDNVKGLRPIGKFLGD